MSLCGDSCNGRNCCTASTFVSHTWGAKFGDLVAAVSDGSADRNRRVWVDIFAVRQWPSHKPDLDFSAVLRQCGSFLIVCSSFPEIAAVNDFDRYIIPPEIRVQIAFLRVWCLVELHTAIMFKVAIIMKGGSYNVEDDEVSFVGDDKMLQNLSRMIDIAAAEATVKSDKERILNLIQETTPGGVEAVNEVIAGVVTGGVFACHRPDVQNAACGDERSLKELLDPKNLGKSALVLSGCGYMPLLQKVFEAGFSATEHREASNLALLTAACGGHLECTKLLLERGSNVNAASNSNHTSIQFAAAYGHQGIVKVLLEYGATVDDTTLESACMGSHFECLELLLSHCKDKSELTADLCTKAVTSAVDNGRVDCLWILLKYGAKVERRDDAIKKSKAKNHIDMVDFLLTLEDDHSEPAVPISVILEDDCNESVVPISAILKDGRNEPAAPISAILEDDYSEPVIPISVILEDAHNESVVPISTILEDDHNESADPISVRMIAMNQLLQSL